jgi:hypothetical protein
LRVFTCGFFIRYTTTPQYNGQATLTCVMSTAFVFLCCV